MTKLGRAAGYELFRSGWHATATLGVFGAAAGASKILGLNVEQTATAIGIAASRASGIRANIGTMVKSLHCGFAARDGLEAALLAASGVTASSKALEGSNGFLETFVLWRGRPTDIISLLGNPLDIEEPGISFKKYPSCLDTHSVIDAVLELRSSHGIQPEQVTHVRCVLAPGNGGDLCYAAPRTPIEGKFSMQFCSAVALACGRVTLDEFSQELIDAPDIRRLIDISEFDFDPDLASGHVEGFCAAARVELTLQDGRVLDKTVAHMRGHPKNPMSASDFVCKFRDCAEGVLGADGVDRALASIEQFGHMPDMRALMLSLTKPAL
jgi:2-methylcitrate dehydratase PrpD